MRYRFDELPCMDCARIAGMLESSLIGARAVNTSFDSFTDTSFHADVLRREGWETINGLGVTPVITADLVGAWPVSHEAYCDEWWIFDREIPADFTVVPFCNFIGRRIAEHAELDFEGGCRLGSYLERFGPRVVFGNNEFSYTIIRDTK